MATTQVNSNTNVMRDALNDLNKIRYAGSDFGTHIDDLRARLQVVFNEDFNNFADSELGIMLLDIVAFGLDTLSFYLDRRATDIYLATARTRKSVARLARQLGYKITGAVPSSVDLTVSLTNTQAFPVPVPVGFKFKDNNGIIFESAQAVTYNIGDGIEDTQIIPCFQGTTFSESFTSTGLPNQIFELTRIGANQFLSFGSVTVLVNGSPYTENEFLTYEQTDQFEVGYGDNPYTIRFGDGIVGNIPTKGATINVTYIATNGKSGLVPAGSITDVVNPLVISSTNVPLTIINEESSVGGDDTESIDHIRSFAGRVFKSRNVAITESDYEALAGSYADPIFGRVAVAKALSSRSASSDIELQNQITIIQSAISDIVPDLETITTNITTETSTITSTLEDITDTKSSLDANIVTVNDGITTMITQERTNKNDLNEVSILCQDLNTDNTTLISSISTISVGSSDTLLSATKTTLLNLLINNGANINNVNTSLASLIAGSSSVLNNLNTVSDLITDIQTSSTTLDTNLETVSTSNESISTNIIVLNDTIENVSSTVESALSTISSHVDEILAADCSANLVTVPILSLNNAGFYAAPSIGLIRSLQDFLDARKEVTQIVQVTSGALFLIPAVITVRLGIFSGFSESIATSTTNAIIEGILRNRKFGESLYVSDLMCDVKELPGIAFANITIDGYLNDSVTDPSKLDANGNLIILDSEVITKGTITINIETV